MHGTLTHYSRRNREIIEEEDQYQLICQPLFARNNGVVLITVQVLLLIPECCHLPNITPLALLCHLLYVDH